MNRRKRVAILVGQAEEESQEKFITGFLTKAFDYEYDVCVFSMYQKWQKSAAREIGESSIFSLIAYEHFDAIVLMLETIQAPAVARGIEENIKRHFSGPVLCIDVESQCFSYIEMDYGESVKKLISHLIEKHGYTDIAYLTGYQGHKHAMQRLKAFKECMAEHGLDVADNRIFYGDFWYNSGEQMVEEILRKGEKMPQAIACANDYMAIGVAKTLTKHGLHVPEDVAVVGYDSVLAGMDSPKPITSAPLSTKKYGEYAADCIKALIEECERPAFEDTVELFIGSSCGCQCERTVPRPMLREQWDTYKSEREFYSPENHMSEDLLSQTTFYDLISVLDDYVYQIRDFDSFHICLNEDWNILEKKTRTDFFSRHMLHVLSCGSKDSTMDTISFDTFFKTSVMLPEIHEQHDKPSVYFFTPLYFETKVFGYAVLCYQNQARSYSSMYRMWLRNVMQELECFCRIEAVQRSHQMLEASMTRDVLTGLYNYNGFLKQRDLLMRKILRSGYKVGVLATDIKELMKINETYGRAEGDQAIVMVARTLKEIFPDGMSVCFGNGEMVTILLSYGNLEKELQKGYDRVLAQIAAYNHSNHSECIVEIYYGIEVGMPRSNEELERLVNVAVSKKNGNKVNERKALRSEDLTEEEYKEAQTVKLLLDDNRFNYHFQPIVDSKTGEIYGYEALMRPDVEPYMAPPVVLKYAEYYERLYDVEKATFFNILDIVNRNQDIFDGSVKVFINSIPGNLLHEEDAVKLEELAKNLRNTVVVELTEQLELTDDDLLSLKNYYDKIGFQTAIDDYGTGYSNVTNLLRYMPNCVKIDRMLLSNIQDSPQKQHFVKDIIMFSHDNNIKVLAEGVETREELQMVIHLGVDLIQGYYTAKPSKDIVSGIPKVIKNEIQEYNRIEEHNRGRRVYAVAKESRISLTRLAAENYSIIEVTSEDIINHDVTIFGAQELETEMYLRIKNGYRGKIILDNVALQGKKHGASIDIGDDCEVILVLQGENSCSNGGIRVPETSKLTIEGDGRLFITVDAANYFGIGNDLTTKHGDLIFNQDGTIEIKGSGMRGIGIGSGLGGTVCVQRGKYIISLIGQEGVGIGSFDGDIVPTIASCDMRIDVGTARAVGIGSMRGDVQLRLHYLAWNGRFNAEDAVGLGTLEGNKCYIDIFNANIIVDMRAYKACGLGTHHGEVLIELDSGAVLVSGSGTEAIAWGSRFKKAQIKMTAARMESRMATTLDTDMGVEVQNISIDGGECYYNVNGEQKMLRSE